jgi:hypothetical protein
MKKLRRFETESARNMITMFRRAGYEDLALTSEFQAAFRAELDKLGIDGRKGTLTTLGPGIRCEYEAELTDEEAALVRLKFFS